MPRETLTLVIATGHGAGLEPLTRHRTKAAVPFGGKFRIIDFTLANCLHSGLRQVLVLTQYKSHSLQKHLRDGWSLYNPEIGEYITPVPPQMRQGSDWYAGPFDAICQNRYLLERSQARQVLILEGDLIYRMDYAEMIRFHRERAAAVTLAVREARRDESPGRIAVPLGEDDRVMPLAERSAADGDPVQLTMGAYLFDKDYLLAELTRLSIGDDEDNALDADEVARLAENGRVFGYRFGGERGRVTPDRYWCDPSSIDAYYQATMALLNSQAPLDLYQSDWTIYTHQGQYPPARTVPGASGTEGIFVNSMLAAGALISGGGVNQSVLFPRVRVRDGAIVEEAVLFGGVEVGEGAHLRRCIIDKDVVVPRGTQIGVDPRADRERYAVSPQGVVVIPKGFAF
ncbi:sugar phosphate nucleotidyltransferase [Thiococcus pfennigii]|jgi:glucose-1-phosphate adenylyltransferase|uniref:sugar phosphate nucleotidyltransferase n=1 Tax=Thiococcus pfennigii TaxID=1057 RepID=UPI001906011D|nr:sugar phosphate nucleotidyltransferase [Thiococcus pfennigii]MBK1702347.1 glucose-1-phosphate adenylyltransferase [Thiococcus pfennigii]MBK1731254.1 glucose-1-phosphate adenylyltransferase [Thiococcus pfennigii]